MCTNCIPVSPCHPHVALALAMKLLGVACHLAEVRVLSVVLYRFQVLVDQKLT